ncbi:helix-turn-helix domain-containing protein [Natronococcus occultus]|uniref:Transcription initiation factor IIE, alpha subunit n=1 Tax=Natronococcus occultus SP4 TaxID=694430 RepID=L0K2Q7_9EURY|nr:helix-turn-helix domain-containing protein [Natronococcus occultus]AGB38649.1 transcription initiation factor IIE, alpha subunit [Natronococcus occultus SP4]
MSTSEQKLAVSEELAIPEELGSSQAKLVYLALLELGDATATELQQLLGLSKLTLLPILSELVADGLADYEQGTYVSR